MIQGPNMLKPNPGFVALGAPLLRREFRVKGRQVVGVGRPPSSVRYIPLGSNLHLASVWLRPLEK